MKCPKCKQEIPDGMRFCSSCGAPLKKKGGMFWKIGLACLLVAAFIGTGIWAVTAWRDKADVQLKNSAPQVTQPAPETQPTQAPTEEPTEPPTEAPTEPETFDYAVYPQPKSFILGENSEDLHYVWNTDTYQYDTGAEGDTITGPNPYYWEQISYDPTLDEQIQAYVAMLEEEPFDLELVYTKDMGDEWVYVYRYTGEREVYPLNISGFVPEDAGEYHMAVDVSKRSTYRGKIGFEIAVGYGLESIDTATCQDILAGLGYERSSISVENFKSEDPNRTFICYYCKAEVIPEEGTYMGDEQIIYCDNCYAEMFATEPTE